MGLVFGVDALCPDCTGVGCLARVKGDYRVAGPREAARFRRGTAPSHVVPCPGCDGTGRVSLRKDTSAHSGVSGT